jgi:ferredoxin--NADP+ reductase
MILTGRPESESVSAPPPVAPLPPAAAASSKVPGELSPDKFTRQTITWIRRWSDHLFSFRTTRDRAFRFAPGQFARLGVYRDDGRVEDRRGPRYVWRAYSVVSASHDEFLEFYSIVVPGGEFTTTLAHLREGDPLLIEKQSYGFMTLDRFEGGRDLWLLASGTGIAPFLSVLQDLGAWEQYQRLILVHSVRHAHELAYRDEVAALRGHPVFGALLAQDPRRLVYVPIVTRAVTQEGTREVVREDEPEGKRAAAPVGGMLNARIPVLLASGALEQAAGVALSPADSRIMICGNPEMVTDVRRTLTGLGYAVSRRARPAQLAVENYW